MVTVVLRHTYNLTSILKVNELSKSRAKKQNKLYQGLYYGFSAVLFSLRRVIWPYTDIELIISQIQLRSLVGAIRTLKENTCLVYIKQYTMVNSVCLWFMATGKQGVLFSFNAKKYITFYPYSCPPVNVVLSIRNVCIIS